MKLVEAETLQRLAVRVGSVSQVASEVATAGDATALGARMKRAGTTERLEALTAVHNYFVPRRDGSTAAERFFGRKPDDLFAHLLDHLDLPARPSTKRSRPPDRQLLN